MGVSKITKSNIAIQGTRVGTPLYLSPELIKQLSYDHKVDIWATGCVLYYIASLQPPFVGDNLIALGNDIVFKEPKELPSIYTIELQIFIRKLMEKRAINRPNANEMIELISSKNMRESLMCEEATLATYEKQLYQLKRVKVQPEHIIIKKKYKNGKCDIRNTKVNASFVVSSISRCNDININNNKDVVELKKSVEMVNGNMKVKSEHVNLPLQSYYLMLERNKRANDTLVNQELPKQLKRVNNKSSLSARKRRIKDSPYKNIKVNENIRKEQKEQSNRNKQSFNGVTCYKTKYNPVIFSYKPADSYFNRNRPTLSSLRNIYADSGSIIGEELVCQRPVSAIPVQYKCVDNGRYRKVEAVNQRSYSAIPKAKVPTRSVSRMFYFAIIFIGKTV